MSNNRAKNGAKETSPNLGIRKQLSRQRESCSSQTGCISTITRLMTRTPNCYSAQRMVSLQNNMLIRFPNGRKQ